jgi:D-serine deaminase-like pyridoxal phosphate-dependent protein
MDRTPLHSLPTPALIVDLSVMESNLRKMADFFRARPTKLRPHFKNHRVLALATRQLDAGAIGITCARLWQAELLAAHGIKNILLANEIAGEDPLRGLVDLSRRVPVIAAVDNAQVASDMARIARNHNTQVHVVVDLDLGLNRCGVQPGEAALALAAKVAASEGLIFRGLMGYEGHLQPLVPGPEKDAAVMQAMKWLVDSKRLIEKAGIAVEIVSCGGTGDYSVVGQYPGITEHQAGAYLLMDRWYAPFAPDFSPALSVLSTVISKTGDRRIVADAGVKAISGERGPCSVKGNAALKVTAVHAEHALIEILEPNTPIEVGTKLELAVQYHDGTVHLHRRMHGVRDGNVEEVFAIEH